MIEKEERIKQLEEALRIFVSQKEPWCDEYGRAVIFVYQEDIDKARALLENSDDETTTIHRPE